MNLKVTVYEHGELQFEEVIREIVHDEKEVCRLLTKTGFHILKCSNHLLENKGNYSKTWYEIAKK